MAHDPGGKVRIALAGDVHSLAEFGGPGDCYRYRLLRKWGPGPLVMFLMMNPSTADLTADDPTVAKCGRFARAWGFGGLLVGNVFAYRATDQGQLARVADPIGLVNRVHLRSMAQTATLRIAAYGTPKTKALRWHGLDTARWLADGGHALHVLRLSKAGVPYHPLYLPESLQPTPWTPPEA